MKRILIIAPTSYPVNGAEAIVNIKLLKALSDDGGFIIDLIAKKNKWQNYPSASIEEYGVKCNLHMVEVDNRVYNPKVVIQNLLCLFTFGVVYKGCHWAVKAMRVAKQLVKSNNYDYVLTKSNPSYLVGCYLKKKYGVKWVASWNDPYPNELYPQPYGHGSQYSDTSTQRRVSIMQNADVHIFPSMRLQEYMGTYMNIADKEKIIIPHIITPMVMPRHKFDGTLRMIHSGKLFSPRSPENLLRGLKQALQLEPELKIKVSILGNMNQEYLDLVSKLELEEYFEYLPPVEYHRSLEMLTNFDVAMIIEANCKEGIFLPTKVGDYMQISVPMFAISPCEGNLYDLYREGYVHFFANVASPNSICDELLKCYHSFVSGDISNRLLKHYYKEEYLADFIVNKYRNI